MISLQLNEKERRPAETNLVFLDDAVLVVRRRRVPGDANGSAVLVSHSQDSNLLRRSTGSWKRRHQISRSPIKYSEEWLNLQTRRMGTRNTTVRKSGWLKTIKRHTEILIMAKY